jgi:hypothetical protein
VSEQDLTRAIIEAINRTGRALVWRNHSGLVKVKRAWMHLAPKGSPDIVGLTIGGRFIGLEVKLPKEQPMEEQLVWGAAIEKSSGIWGIVRSVDEALNMLRAA